MGGGDNGACRSPLTVLPMSKPEIPKKVPGFLPADGLGARDSDAGLGSEHRGWDSLSTQMKALLEAGLCGCQSIMRETGH